MVVIDFDFAIHLLGELRYVANCTLAAAYGSVAYMEVGEERKHGAESFATPWNRTTIPCRYLQDVGKGRKHDCMDAGGRATQELVAEERKPCALPAWTQVLSVSRSGSCALHHRKRTLHHVQLQVLG